MSTEKISRKEIRNPDPFVRVTSAFWAKAMEHQKVIGLALLGAFALFIVAALIVRTGQSKGREAGGALASALALAHRPVEGTLDALQQDPTAEKFKTFKEKNEALAKALEEVRTQHAGSPAARTSTLFWADAQFQLGKLDEAAKGYDQFLAEAPASDPLRMLALEGRGYVYEAKKELDKAIETFEKMSREAAGEPGKARAAYHKARLLEAQGKKPEAAAAFQKLKDEFKEAPAAREAEERLALLAMQGVPMPEKAKPDSKTTAEEPPKK
ncbi:MAG: tetratricopeptide repeat protein [Deltaproteobacteria bacterium]|nr:tetratricopeptide repeat protein [Deltaproteobacteria bacterium]